MTPGAVAATSVGLSMRGLLIILAALGPMAAACSGSTEPIALPPSVAQPDPQPGPPSPGGPGEHIYVANADGSDVTLLTVGGRPAWSPDGRRIAFQRDGGVYVIGVDGSGVIQLTEGSSPAWSPDGAKIAFTGRDGIRVLTLDDLAVRALVRHDFRADTDKPSDQGVDKPAWSPDGARIAFEHLGDGEFTPAQVFVIGADGSNRYLLTTSPDRRRYAESDPSWSPDGSSIVHWSFGFGIALTPAVGGVPKTIYAAFPQVAYGTKPVWSRLGVIAFIATMGPTKRSVWTMTASGGEVRQLIDDAFDADWSPTGARIAFVRTRTQ
jgi:TolB protein